MHTVLGIDLQTLLPFRLNDLIDARRAITLSRLVKQRQVGFERDIRILQFQLTRLIFLMIGIGQEHRGKLVETNDAIRLGISDLRALASQLQPGVIGSLFMQGERQLSLEPILIQVVEGTAQQGAEPVHGRAEVACPMELIVYP
ncbi:hypothetical protein D3C84_983810 [compost metagenome]